ncbi:MAG: BsuBI/PstI family type II restriction endonuclease [Anaerolineae bacterium]
MNEAVEILHSVGIPLERQTQRRLERTVVCFLAVAGVTDSWQLAQGLDEKRHLKTRDIINFVNQYFEENISSGSYDDIRRKDLRLLVLAGLVINSGDNLTAATNDPTRGYSLEPAFTQLVKTFQTKAWPEQLASYLQGREILSETLARKRDISKIPVALPGGKSIQLSPGAHNLLQKQVIEEFLPRFGGEGCQVLYLGDTSNKILHIAKDELERLNFFELSHEELPDIMAHNPIQNWLYLIEAIHSSGPMNKIRILELKHLTKSCSAKIIFVTAFLTKDDFRKWVMDITWETEVWIADNPDHLIHFDGEKYLSPY